MKVNKWKWGVLAAIIIIVFFVGRGCGIKSVISRTGSDTTVRKDSIVIRYKPMPYKVIDIDTAWIKKPVPYKVVDTFTVYDVRIDPADTAAILAMCSERVYYDTTVHLKRGIIRIRDTVQHNRLQGRELFLNVTDSIITNTITKTIPRRYVGYFTVSGSFPVYGAGFGLALKNPKDFVYQTEIKFMQGHKPTFEGRLLFPIRLTKK